MSKEPYIETREPQPYGYMECDAPDGDVGKVAPPLIGKLKMWLDGKGVKTTGAPFFNYVAIGDQMQLHIEVCFPVKHLGPQDAEVHFGVLPAGRYATLRHLGPYDQLRAANERLFNWGKEKGLTWEGYQDGSFLRCKARYEVYLTDPGVEKDPAKFETDVVFLIQDKLEQ